MTHARGTLRLTRYGHAGTDALRELIAQRRAGDPLAPVFVVVPTALAGVTIRRRLAVPGIANLHFLTMPQLVSRLVALGADPGVRPPLTESVRRALTRTALRDSGALAAVAGSAAAQGVVAGLLSELDDAEAGQQAIGRLRDSGGWATAVAEVYDRYLDARAGYLHPAAAVDAAITAVGDRTPPVIVHLPRWLSPGEIRLCRALARRNLVDVVLGLTGDATADKDAVTLREGLAGVLNVVEAARPVPRVWGSGFRASPDPEEEARAAVRDLLLELQRGGARAERTAIAYRARVPYARLVHEQLCAAGLPHHVPQQRTLAQTMTGRALLGLLTLPREQFSRLALFEWLTSCPVRADGAQPPADRWHRLAIEAGVARGLGQWHDRLDRLAETIVTRLGDSQDTGDQESRRSSHQRRLEDIAALRSFVDDLAGRCHGIGAAISWTQATRLTREALEQYLGGAATVARWAPHPGIDDRRGATARARIEAAAFEQITAMLESLAGLDSSAADGFDPEVFRGTLSQELQRWLSESEGLGRGVLAGHVADFAGADLDVVFVLGMTEGGYPPRGREHPLLRDDARRSAGLRTLADRRAAERRDHLAVLASAQTVRLSYPLVDPRAQRATQPSPWLLESLSMTNGRPVYASEVRTILPASSFEGELLRAVTEMSAQEYDVRLLLSGGVPVRADHPLTQAEPGLRCGLESVIARRDGVFGPWLGGLTLPAPDAVTARLAGPLSATALQSYAACPFSYFAEHVLGVEEMRIPDEDTVSPLDRGTLVHAVLQHVVARSLGRDPGTPWSAADHAYADRLLAGAAAQLLAEGKAGRAMVWQAKVASLHRGLRRVLLADDEFRQQRGMRPVAAEHGFGVPDGPALPVEVLLPSGGRVQLRGSVDRIDRDDAGDLVVLDYKTGDDTKYGTFPKEGHTADGSTDLVDRGRRLQLPLYALAARRDFGTGDSDIEGYYWFVDQGGARRGGPITPADQQRFLDVLDTVVTGIQGGVFPVHPGELGYFGHDNCGFCPFDRACSAARSDVWQALSGHERVARYASLAEPATAEPGINGAADG